MSLPPRPDSMGIEGIRVSRVRILVDVDARGLHLPRGSQ